jgi:hypothetical protein
VLETGAVAAEVALAQLAEMPPARVQEMVAPEQRRLSQGLFSRTPVEAVAEVVPIATHQHRADLVVTAVAEMVQRPPTRLRHACR